MRKVWVGGMLVAWAAIVPIEAVAAGKTLVVSDGICEYRLAYDPATTDRARLKATFDALTGSDAPLELGPPLNEPADVAGIDVAQYRADCAAHRARLATPQFVDLPGIEDWRKRDIAALDEFCQMTDGKLRAAKGDISALRGFAPAAACTRYADALDAPNDKLKARYDDLLEDMCRTSTERGPCMDHLQKQGEGPNKIAQMRLVLLTQGWAECAGAHSLVAGTEAGADSPGDRQKQTLKDALLKRFKAKTLSCAQ